VCRSGSHIGAGACGASVEELVVKKKAGKKSKKKAGKK
jgi:hypothetical protein